MDGYPAKIHLYGPSNDIRVRFFDPKTRRSYTPSADRFGDPHDIGIGDPVLIQELKEQVWDRTFRLLRLRHAGQESESGTLVKDEQDHPQYNWSFQWCLIQMRDIHGRFAEAIAIGNPWPKRKREHKWEW